MRYIFLYFILLFAYSNIYAQDDSLIILEPPQAVESLNAGEAQGVQVNPIYKSDVIPPSPDAQAFHKYGEYQFNVQKGQPNIEIPLYTVIQGDIQIPISLRYETGGIRVDQLPGCTGLGWVLDAGGVLSRTINGLPDEGNGGYAVTSPSFSIEPWQNISYFKQLANSEIDAKPDVYSYAVPGLSGKFIFNNSQQIEMLPRNGNLVVPTLLSGSFQSWDIIDPYGNTYRMGSRYAIPAGNYREFTDVVGSGGLTRSNNTTGWYLGAVKSANNTDTIQLEYIDYDYPLQLSLSEKRLQRAAGYIGVNTPYFQEVVSMPEMSSSERIYGKLVSKILSNKDSVIFYYSINTYFYTSAAGNSNPRKLDSIVIFSRPTSARVKKYQFNYDYFISGTEKRLKLISLAEYGADGTAIPPYTFSYNNTMCNFLSKSRDHWGYYNGQNNSSLLPEGYFCTGGMNYANREPNAGTITMGMLTAINYPTGGSTQFEWEPHDYSYIGSYNNSPVLGQTQDITAGISLNSRQPTYTELLLDPDPNPFEARTAFTLSSKSGFDKNLCALPSSGTAYNITINYNIDKCIHGAATVLLSLRNITTNTIVWSQNNSSNCPVVAPVQGTTVVSLAPGNYELSIVMQAVTQNPPVPVIYNSSLSILPVTILSATTTKTGGGVRIKKITNIPAPGEEIVARSFVYKDNPTDNKSSGLLNGRINYLGTMSYHSSCPQCCSSCSYDRPVSCPLVSQGVVVCEVFSCNPIDVYYNYYALQSNPLGEPIQHLGYRTVYEYFGTEYNNTGYIKHEFNIEPYSAYFSSNGVSGIYNSNPLITFDWSNGLLKKQSTYSAAGQVKQVVESEFAEKVFPGYTAYWTVGLKQDDPYIVNLPCDISVTGNYFEYDDPWIFNTKKNLVKSIQTTYDDNGNGSVSTTYIFHDNASHYQPVMNLQQLPDGKYAATRNTFTGDITGTYGNGSNSAELQDILFLKTKNALALPVEQAMYYARPTGALTINPAIDNPDAVLQSPILNAKVISSQYLQYNSTAFQPSGWWRLRLNQPLAAIAFNPVSSSNFQISKHADYEKQLTIRYNSLNRLAEEITPDSIGAVYLWDTYSRQPVAQVNGSRESTSYYTSFESPGKITYAGATTAGTAAVPAKTGYYYYSGNLSAQGVPAGQYTLSLWTRGSAGSLTVTNGTLQYESAADAKGWKYAEFYLNIPANNTTVNINGGSSVDEVRLYPYGALMTTFNYDRSWKLMDMMTSDGQVQRYSYDGLQRLKAIYDQNRYLRKEIQYNYGF